MEEHYLKMNADKTNVLFIGKPDLHSCFSNLSITIGGEFFKSNPNDVIRSLGSYFNGTLSMDVNVNDVVKSCNFSLKKLNHLRFCLTEKTKLILIKSFILSKIDYNNILHANITQGQINRLQAVVKDALRFVYSLKKRDDGISQLMKSAHILPVKFRIKYKQCVFAFNVINKLSPHYLSSLVSIEPPQSRNLRSNEDNLLLLQTQDCTQLQLSIIEQWNKLPYELRSITSDINFKSNLKTHYFNLAYNST